MQRKNKGNARERIRRVLFPKAPTNPKPTAKERPAKDDACHHCKEVGHWKRNCPVYLAELQKKRKQVGSASSSDNCHYAPTITRGVVLVSRLVDNGFVQCFTDCGISVSKNGVLYFNVVPRNGIYEIDMHDLVPNVNSIYNLQQDGLLKSTDDESFDKCESCLSGKMTKKPFPHSNERAKDLLGIIHTDIQNLIVDDAYECGNKSMMDNMVWVLVDLPPGCKTVGSRWLFKKKTDMDGIVHVYKARLVAKGYTQLYGVDYEETFSPVADIRAIRILISIAAYYDYEIWQIDVKTTFLIGYPSMKTSICVQPEVLLDTNHPGKDVQVQRSI
ncbi:retrotransposon protein, putative, ty1-copia subclass [Tanacetum coccineum]